MIDRRSSDSTIQTIEDANGQNAEARRSSLSIVALISKWFMPGSRFSLSWDIFVFIIILYNSIFTPIRIFIMSGQSTPSELVAADVVFDFIFVVDTILHFFRPYIDEDTGQIVTDRKAIKSKYLGSISFYIDAIACIPILKTPISPLISAENMIALSTNFNVLRMFRVLHFPSQFNELKKFRSQKGPVNESVFRMNIILFFTFLLMCIFGCVYFGWSTAVVDDICPSRDLFEKEILGAEMWVASDFVITDVMDPEVCQTISPIHCDSCPQDLFFTRSIYFLMQTLFTIGYGDSVVPSKSTVEMSLACVFMIFGVFGYGLIIANMTSVLSNLDVVSVRFRHEMDTLSRWLSFRCVPALLRDRINMHFTYLNRKQHGVLDDTLFNDLPPQLSQDFAALNIDLLIKIPFFNRRYRSDNFLACIASALARRVYPPGSFVQYQDERQKELLIVKSGKADIYIGGSKASVGNLLPGDFVGDYQLLFGTANQVSVKSPEFLEVLVLTYDAFADIMNHPDQSDFEFKSIGSNFRSSDDQGALDTIEHYLEFLKKISKTASNVASGQRSEKMKHMMEETKMMTKGYRILPTSKIHVYWDIFALTATMYYSVASPVRFAVYFRSGSLHTSYNMSFVIDYLFDIIFMVDIYLRMNIYACVTYESGRPEVIVDKTQMRQSYKESRWFVVDCLAAIPYDLFSAVLGYHTLFRFPKMMRAIQIPGMISRLRKNLLDCMDVTMNEAQVSSLVMFLCSFLIVVWSSAGWNAIRPNENAYDSIYWAFTTLTTVGYGDLTPTNFPQTCYALFVGAVGATFSAAIIANVTSFFHDVEISEDNIDHKVNCTKFFMERHNASLDNIKKIQEYFDYMERGQNGFNEEILLNRAVPDHIKHNILIHITHSMVLENDFFSGCESGFIRKVMVLMEQRFFGSQFMVLDSVTPANGMYFVKKGAVELLIETEGEQFKVTRKVEADESFAEACLLERWEQNPYLARTASECELWFLHRSTFDRLVEEFPHVRKLFGKLNKKAHVAVRRASVHAVQKAAELARRKKVLFVHPDNLFIQVWLSIVLVVTLYNSIILPFRVAFMENHEITISWLVIDYIGDTILVADMVIRGAFLAFYDDNHLVVRRKEIWQHYRKSRKMICHLLSVFPFEVAAIFVPTMCPLWKMQVWSLFRLNRNVRIKEMSTLFNRVETSLAKAGVKVPKNPLRVGKLLMVILLSAHIVACVFFMIANFDQHMNSGDTNNQNNWANTEGLLSSSPVCPGDAIDSTTIIKQYVAALYWSIATLTTVGYGDITANKNSVAEILFATAILIVGTAAYTLVIALLEDIVSQLDVTSSLHKMKMNRFDIYSQLQGLPDGLKAKIVAYYEYLWRTQRGVKGKTLLQYLPRPLRANFVLDMLSPLVKKTFFIKDCPNDIVAKIMDSLSLEIFLPDDTIFIEGEQCNALNLLYKGEVDLLTPNKVKFMTVSDVLLGETSFFGFEPHICTAKASDTCEIFQLSMTDFMSCMQENRMVQKYVDYLDANQESLLRSKASMEKMIQNLKSSKMTKMLVTEADTSIPKGVILPETNFRQIWDAFAFAAVLIFTFAIPHQISFSDEDVRPVQFIFDAILDFFFLLDIYARSNHFAVMKDGFLICCPKEFRKIYLNSEFFIDLVSAIPASSVSFCFGIRDDRNRVMRLFQLVRILRFGKYLDSFVETMHTKARIIISTATMRIIQMFIFVVILCHWLACAFYFIGKVSTDADNWLVADGVINDPTEIKYLRSFYWALYTVSTVGYGSVPVVSNAERIFAMFVMAIGAIICDAGITAVLTSIISNKDHQAGTNSRRIQCCKLFMKEQFVDKSLQERVLDYYNYADTELRNIDENGILDELSECLRCEVLRYFCFETLRSCSAFEAFSDGAIVSFINKMTPYLAIPGENITEIGKKCSSLFILQRGFMSVTDAAGGEVNVPAGTLIGHVATSALNTNLELPSMGLRVELLAAHGLKVKNGNPYAIIRCGAVACRSSIKKSKNWRESLLLKLTDHNHTASITIRGWRRRQFHPIIGSADVSFASTSGDNIDVVLQDAQGKRAGTIKLKMTYFQLSPNEVPSNYEVTSTATGYCHLYRMDAYEVERKMLYFSNARRPRMKDRISPEYSGLYESMLHRSIPASPNSDLSKSETTLTDGSEEHVPRTETKKSSITKRFTLERLRKRTASVSPLVIGSEKIALSEGMDKKGYPEGTKEQTKPKHLSEPISSKNEVETVCPVSPSYKSGGSDNDESKKDLPSDRDWENLIDLSHIGKKEKRHKNRRPSFFVEWGEI